MVTLNFLKSYLNNRSQFVEDGNAKSGILSINIGVPQGSMLGPVLFIIIIIIIIIIYIYI